MVRSLTAAALCLVCFACFAQGPASPQVGADGSITFRYANAGAMQVSVSVEGQKAIPLVRGDDGVWSVTTLPMTPEIYGYSFTVDGHKSLDPRNPETRRNFMGLSNNVLVPAQPPAPWEAKAIAHGQIDVHRYTTRIVKNLPASQSSYLVYTPPGYDARRKGGYPVLYLLHGWSDYESAWVEVGHAHDMMDAMIANGQAVPMIVVMPLGYGDLDFVTQGRDAWKDSARMLSNLTLFTQALEDEVIPFVERSYNISTGRASHAIAGLSMGGLESLYVGLRHTDQFAWIGGFSSAIQDESFDELFASVSASAAARKARLRLLWVACGTEDALITPNRDFVTWARTKGLPLTPVETPGGHNWLVWRDDLLHFAPLLFRAK